jgi:hypothetical protein
LLDVKLDGAHCTGSPFLLNIRPARAVAVKSRFALTRISAHAGRPFAFRLLLHDCFGNRASVGQADVQVELRRAIKVCESPRLLELMSEQGRHWSKFKSAEAGWEPEQAAKQTVRCTVRGGEGRAAECHAVCMFAGEWVATALVDDVQSAHRLCVDVAPAAPDSRFSVLCAVRAGARLEAVAGESHTLGFVPRDAHGCDCVPDETWRAVLVRVDGFGASGGRGAHPYAPVTIALGMGGAGAQVTFLAQRAGAYQLRMERAVAEQSVLPVCYRIRVCPSARDAEGFDLLGEGLACAVAGELARVVVRPRSFGAAAEVARETFAALAAALEVRAAVDGRVYSAPVSKRREEAGAMAVRCETETVNGSGSVGQARHEKANGGVVDLGSDLLVTGATGQAPEEPTDDERVSGAAAACSGSTIALSHADGDIGRGPLVLQPDEPIEAERESAAAAKGLRATIALSNADGDTSEGLPAFQPDGPGGEEAEREEWHLHYTCNMSGPAVLRVTVNGAPVGGAPLNIRVLPGRVFSPACTVGGLVSEWVVGKPLVLQLTLRDRLGNPRESGGNRIVLRLVRLAASAQAWRKGSAVVVTDVPGQAPDGRTDAERVSAAAAMSGQEASPSREALTEATARAVTSAAEDTSDGSLGVEGGCEGGSERGRPLVTRTEREARWGGIAEFPASEVVATDHGNGKVELLALVCRAGLYGVRVLVDGDPVPLSHGRVSFLPAKADPRRCQLGGEAATGQVPTNRYAPLIVTLRDCFGNLAYHASGEEAPPRLELSLLQGSAQLLLLQPVAHDCVPKPEGHFEARVKPLVPGPLVLGVCVDGEWIGGEPLSILAHAGPTVARQCFCSGSGWAKVVPAGTKLAFAVHARDIAGHAQTKGTDSFAVLLSPRAYGQHFRGMPKHVNGKRLDASSTLFEMGPLTRGPYILSVCMRGIHVSGSPLHLEAEDRSNGRPMQKPQVARSPRKRSRTLQKG